MTDSKVETRNSGCFLSSGSQRGVSRIFQEV